MKTFKEVELLLPLLYSLEEIGFINPTPIQAKAIPPALKGSDILGSSQTGTGKTGAFGIPLVNHLLKHTQSSSLILLPTRELAFQVMNTFQQFFGKSKISAALLIGGEEIEKQFRQLQAHPRLIIGTPGRINDHLARRTLRLDNTDFLVLDEVDRMLDMGFGIQLDAIIKHLTVKRQTLMFSATISNNIKKLSAKYLRDPVRISVGSVYAPTTNVKQEHVKLLDSEKYPKLLEELDTRSGSIIVFVKAKYLADSMTKKLKKIGHKVNALHGDLSQNKRNSVIAGFRKQNYRILVATDVASRGLDIPHIKHVINYDLPQCPEDYIHRVGRTARAGATGEALSFLSPSDNIKWKAIQRLINPGAKIDDLDELRKNKKTYHKGRKRKTQYWQRRKRSAA